MPPAALGDTGKLANNPSSQPRGCDYKTMASPTGGCEQVFRAAWKTLPIVELK